MLATVTENIGAHMRPRILRAWDVLRGKPRRLLRNRRTSINTTIECQGFEWMITVSYFDNGNVAEIFASTAKTGELLRDLTNDAAIATSLALQFGCTQETLLSALTRNSRGEAVSPIAIALERAIKISGAA